MTDSKSHENSSIIKHRHQSVKHGQNRQDTGLEQRVHYSLEALVKSNCLESWCVEVEEALVAKRESSNDIRA
jgi:hypothetical protein